MFRNHRQSFAAAISFCLVAGQMGAQMSSFHATSGGVVSRWMIDPLGYFTSFGFNGTRLVGTNRRSPTDLVLNYIDPFTGAFASEAVNLAGDRLVGFEFRTNGTATVLAATTRPTLGTNRGVSWGSAPSAEPTTIFAAGGSNVAAVTASGRIFGNDNGRLVYSSRGLLTYLTSPGVFGNLFDAVDLPEDDYLAVAGIGGDAVMLTSSGSTILPRQVGSTLASAYRVSAGGRWIVGQVDGVSCKWEVAQIGLEGYLPACNAAIDAFENFATGIADDGTVTYRSGLVWSGASDLVTSFDDFLLATYGESFGLPLSGIEGMFFYLLAGERRVVFLSNASATIVEAPSFVAVPVTPVPEPLAIALASVGVFGAGLLASARRRS